MAGLDAMILAAQELVTVTSADDPDRAGRLSSLSVALMARFEQTGTAEDPRGYGHRWQFGPTRAGQSGRGSGR